MTRKRRRGTSARRSRQKIEEDEDRAFTEFCVAGARSAAALATREYERTSDPRFAWMAYQKWRMLQKWVTLQGLDVGVDERLPDSVVQYLDGVADRIVALEGGNLGRGLVEALGFKRKSTKGRTGPWNIRAAAKALDRDVVLALKMHELINGEYKGQTDAAARAVPDGMLKQYQAFRDRARKRLEQLPEEERRRWLELGRAKSIADLHVKFERQVAEYKKILPSPSTVQRAYRRVFGKSPTS